MMKKTLLFLMAFFLTGIVSRAALQQDEKGWYLIGTADDLVSFSRLVNNDNRNVNARLTADIDLMGVENFTPIGLYADKNGTQFNYQGTFDGQGHVIKNLRVIRDGDWHEAGLFSRTYQATIKNLGIINAYIYQSEGVRAGVIAGEAHISTIENCFTAGNIEVITDHAQCAGIAGEAAGGTPIRNCYTTYDVLGCEGGNIQNSYEGSEALDMAATGELCYTLNGDQSQIVYYQTLGVDEYPVQDPAHGQVYAVGNMNCDGTRLDDNVKYSNEGGSVIPPHSYDEEGFCSNCGVDAGQMQPDEDGWYNVTTGEQLRWLSRQTQIGVRSQKIRLMNDIDMSGIEYMTPIGYFTDNDSQNNSRNYNGTFDGQNHIIYYLTITMDEPYEVGFFGRTEGATIKNLGIVNAHMTSNAGIRTGVLGGELLNTTVTNCFTAGDLYLSTDKPQIGGIAAEASGGRFTNCYTVHSRFADIPASLTNCFWGAEAANGAPDGSLAYKMNGGELRNPIWYQTLGTDEFPVLDSTHGLVYLAGEDEYASATTPEEYAALVAMMVDAEKTQWAEKIVTANILEEYLKNLDEMKDMSFIDFLDAYEAKANVRTMLKESEEAYAAFKAKAEETLEYLEQNPLEGATAERLMSYLNDVVEPGDVFPNGSYTYIYDHHTLSTKMVKAETDGIEEMLQTAMKSSYTPGTDISSLAVNTDFSNGMNGWKVSNNGEVTTDSQDGHYAAWATGWAQVNQTITGLKPGIYEVVANAAFLSAGDAYNCNYMPQLFANTDSIYVMQMGEDFVSYDKAEDGVNCLLDSDEEYFSEDSESGYIPSNKKGAAIAFSAGRYVNRIATTVAEDGTLTFGITKPIYNNDDRTFFGNFHIIYLGTEEQASEELTTVLKGETARIEYIASVIPDDVEPVKCPTFSQDIKEKLINAAEAANAATTGKEKMQHINEFTALWQEVVRSKAAYVEMMATLEELLELYGENDDPDYDTFYDYYENIVYNVYGEGTYTTEKVLEEIESMKQNKYYLFKHGVKPAMAADGYYELTEPTNLFWFSNEVNSGNTGIKGRLMNDIDLGEYNNFTPIGLFNDNGIQRAFTGTFDGNYHVVRNLTVSRGDGCEAGFFSRTNNATVQNFGIINAYVSNGAHVRAGIIAGEMVTSTIRNCFSAGELTVYTSHDQIGGLAGEAHESTPNNCYTTFDVLVAGGHKEPVNCYEGYMVTEEIGPSGELCYLLNGNQENIIFYQKLGEDQFPTFDETRGQVYLAAELYCDGTVKEDAEASYSNDPNATKVDDHDFENGFCTVCEMPDANPVQAEDGYYEIRNAMDICWLSHMANKKGITNFNARLMNDVDMKDIHNFTPICEYMDGDKAHQNTYTGTFDGQGYEIQNFSLELDVVAEAGLFGRTYRGSKIMNLGVRNAHLVNSHPSGARMGVIAGECHYGIIENCYSINVTIDSKHQQKAGIAGEAAEGQITNCYTTYDYLANRGTITNCYEGSDVAAMGATGELCYKLNQGNVETPVFFQTLGTDALPTLRGESIVYLSDDGETYTNVKPTGTDLELSLKQADLLARSVKEYDGLITSASQITSNCQWDAQGSIEELLDGRFDTFFHSTTAMNLYDGKEYLEVALAEPVSAFYLYFVGRNDGIPVNIGWHATPNKIRIEGSNDPDNELSWVEIATVEYEDLPNDHAATHMDYNPTQLGAEYSNIRLYMLSTTSKETWWNMSELQFFGTTPNAVCKYNTIDGLADAMDTMDAIAAELQEKLDADRTSITAADVARLDEAIARVQAIIDADIEDAILGVQTNNVMAGIATEGTYTLAGQRIAKGQRLSKGIYIINGKKIAVK